VPVIPIPVTRLFKAVLTARACTCKLSTSFLCPIGRNRHKSTDILLSARTVLHDAVAGFKTLTKRNQLTNEAHLKLKLRASYRTHRPMTNSGETRIAVWQQRRDSTTLENVHMSTRNS